MRGGHDAIEEEAGGGPPDPQGGGQQGRPRPVPLGNAEGADDRRLLFLWLMGPSCLALVLIRTTTTTRSLAPGFSGVDIDVVPHLLLGRRGRSLGRPPPLLVVPALHPLGALALTLATAVVAMAATTTAAPTDAVVGPPHPHAPPQERPDGRRRPVLPEGLGDDALARRRTDRSGGVAGVGG